MRLLRLTILLLAFFNHLASAQEPAANEAGPSISAWRAVLEPGRLHSRPEIEPVQAGFAISAASFAYPSWSFSTDWLLYDPASDSWSSYVPSPEPSRRVNISQFSLAYPELADMFPAEAEPGIQFIDGGRRAVFLVDAGESLADHWRYFGVKILDLATGASEKLNLWTCWGVPHADAIVWEFPEDKLIVSCHMLVWLDGSSIRQEWMSAYIGQDEVRQLHLLATSPDNRYWILRERFWYDPWHGDYLLVDRQTGWTTVLLWRDWRIPYHAIVWLSDTTFIVNEGDSVMHFDTETYERRLALEDEIWALPDEPAYSQPPYLSRDGQWLLVPTEGGGLMLRNVFDALGIRP